MTGPQGESTSKPAGGLLRWVLGSMWAYWLTLLAFSMGLAVVIYLIWLRGSV